MQKCHTHRDKPQNDCHNYSKQRTITKMQTTGQDGGKKQTELSESTQYINVNITS